jgi:hypothetical protein
VNRDFDLVGVSGERFVDRIVHDFVNEMMKSNLTRRADRLSSLLDQRRQAALSLGTQHRCPQGRQRDTRLWCESSRE